jgi:head-tail adaptor
VTGEFAGRLGERVTLYRPVPDRDPLGGWTGGWAVRGSAWALVEPDGMGAESVGEAPGAAPRWRVTMRPQPLIVGDRIGWGAAQLRVRAIRTDPATPDRMIVSTEEQP